jgi:hypothetical protein
MKISVNKRHIKAAQLGNGHMSPIEIAVAELDCFEEVQLYPNANGSYAMEIDGSFVTLPRNAQKAMAKWESDQLMRPMDFELPIHNAVYLDDDALMLEGYEDGLDIGMGFGAAY